MGSPNFSPRAARAATLVFAALFCTACGNRGLEGKYYWRDQKRAGVVNFGEDSIEYEFISGNKVRARMWGWGAPDGTLEFDYEFTGKEIKLKQLEGITSIGTITDNGCLDFGEKKLYCKEKKK